MMKQSTIDKLNEIERGHDWVEGQTYSGGGLSFYSTDKCRYCGLIRHWEKDDQNNIPSTHSFEGYDGIKDVPSSCE